MAKRKRIKHIGAVELVNIRPGRMIHFNEYLFKHIGATWNDIKNSLYAAGYSTMEVFNYREKLLEDFNKLCRENHVRGIIHS